MLPFEKLIFVWKKLNGSAMMMAYQPFIVCTQKNIPCSVVSKDFILKECQDIKNSVLFLVKTDFDIKIFEILNKNKNKIVYIPGDTDENHIVNYAQAHPTKISGIVVSNESIIKKIQNQENIKIKTIVHNFDLFLDQNKFKNEREEKLRFLFSGAKDYRGVPLNGDLGWDKLRSSNPDLEFEETYWCPLKDLSRMTNLDHKSLEHYSLNLYADSQESNSSVSDIDLNPSKWSCHYGVRAPWVGDYAAYWSNKSATKLITAAGSGANIITSLDPAVMQLIDKDYPYAIDTELSKFRQNYDQECDNMIKKVKETYKTKVWFDGLEMLREVREKTSCEVITQQYINFAQELF